MRIVSGRCRGRVIVPPANLKARPTTDFAKENLFNVLANRYDWEPLAVLDLFSGTGSISYEFASRGAKRVVSVEGNATHQRFIAEMARKLSLNAIASVRTNVFVYLKSCRERFDLVFADPPYDLAEADRLPDMILDGGWLKERGTFILEHSRHKDYSAHPCFQEKRTYGSVNFSFFGRNSETDDTAL